MGWREWNVVEERLRFVILASRAGANVTALCREFGISRQTGHAWKKRFREGGASQVVDRSRRPEHSPSRTPVEIEDRVVSLRKERPDWGAPKLQVLLAQSKPEWGRISVRTVHRILERRGCIQDADRHPGATRRFERSAPNELWQMDFKGAGAASMQSGNWAGPLSILDDHSRYLVALRQLGSTRLEGVRETLATTFTQAGMPEAMLVDHGVPWWNAASPWGLTELTVWIMQHGVRLCFSGLRHPQTQGKVERMHGALERAVKRRRTDPCDQLWLDEFRHEYNHLRPHEALGMKTPASRWSTSQRTFEPTPAPWNYAPDMEVVRLSKQGQLQWRGRRWELSRALRHQAVGIQILAGRAIVYFCNTPMRELDLTTGHSFAIPADVIGSLHC